ncbi:hypothetical protein CSC2_08530 [Clostridium zeae]|uniref:[acyl-carrier-protein] S-malonyltransferase n=1 Tax=Clostridium zeae TaxID=2759022 RepID=A0ABQ1E6D2_9CLOT|nr:ACP S-malonyltransferase [Clostridium zeae]GFZ30327.1 hypothetical protein CSC2_08530 [Clostridium zeae]
MSKLAFLYSGQGSQYVGMCKGMYDEFAIVRQTFEEANEILGFDLRNLCFNGDLKELSKTENTQPCILTVSIAQMRVYMQELRIEPSFLAGHSLGEYSALVGAGAIEFADALRLVRLRGKFMKESEKTKSGSMMAIRNISEKIVSDEIDRILSEGNIICISNYNGADNLVISGESEAVKGAGEVLKSRGAEVIGLNVSSAFHSPLMEKAAEKLKSELDKYKFNDLKYNVISNVTALPYRIEDNIADMLTSQIVKPVRWKSTMDYLSENGVDTIVEFGPRATLRNLAKANMKNIRAYSYDKKDDVVSLKENVESKLRNKRYNIISRSLGMAVSTKNYNSNNEQYKKGVVEPYEKIERLRLELEAKNIEPSIEQMNSAVEMLKSVFKTKGTTKAEQVERFRQLFKETNTEKYFKNFHII